MFGNTFWKYICGIWLVEGVVMLDCKFVHDTTLWSGNVSRTFLSSYSGKETKFITGATLYVSVVGNI